MKIAWTVAPLLGVACIFASCASQPSGDRFVLQRIPIEIQSGKSVEVQMRTTGGNEVGIRCSPEAWNTLTNSAESVTVQLISSNKKGTFIHGIGPGSGKKWPIESFYYLFQIHGECGAKALVEITFRNAPPGVTHAELIVCKHPADFVNGSVPTIRQLRKRKRKRVSPGYSSIADCRLLRG